MNVVVTGAGGFVGSHLVESQARQGHRVRALDLRAKNLEHLRGHPSVEIHEGSVTDPDLLRRVIDGADVVYHLASVHLEISVPDETYWRVNVHGVRQLLELCAEAGVGRVVHCSSVGVYGKLSVIPSDEESPCRPETIYERTKLEGERVVREVVAETGLPVAIIRPGWIYGPRCPRTLKLFRAIAKGRYVLVGSGRSLRQPVYVDDMVAAIERAGACPAAIGETFVISGPEAVTIAELSDAVARTLGKPPVRLRVPYALIWPVALAAEAAGKATGKEPPMSRRSLKFFDGSAAFDISKARRVLEFEPMVKLDDGLRRSLAWMRAEGLV